MCVILSIYLCVLYIMHNLSFNLCALFGEYSVLYMCVIYAMIISTKGTQETNNQNRPNHSSQ
nr:MAG TPA: hypothetical protein [Caudoviricetes sp.]